MKFGGGGDPAVVSCVACVSATGVAIESFLSVELPSADSACPTSPLPTAFCCSNSSAARATGAVIGEVSGVTFTALFLDDAFGGAFGGGFSVGGDDDGGRDDEDSSEDILLSGPATFGSTPPLSEGSTENEEEEEERFGIGLESPTTGDADVFEVARAGAPFAGGADGPDPAGTSLLSPAAAACWCHDGESC